MVLTLAVVGAASLVQAVTGSSAGATDRPSLVSAQVHVVQPGETYWSIASELDRGDVRGTVDALVAANGGRSLQAGDRLTLPPG